MNDPDYNRDFTTEQQAAAARGVNQFTYGAWGTEEEGMADLDNRLKLSECFTIYREVAGFYTQPRLYTPAEKEPRIDRLLTPTKKLLEKGWRNGVIGIECKAPGKKLGEVIPQCLDYSRAVFTLPAGGIAVMCNWVFLWQAPSVVGDIAGLMAQHRVGTVSGTEYCLLSFKSAGPGILTISRDGEVRIGNVTCGSKVGSR